MSSDDGSLVQKYRQPIQAFSELMHKAIRGTIVEQGDYMPCIFRAFVYAIDRDGGRLQNETGTISEPVVSTIIDTDGTKFTYTANVRPGPDNPPDSIKARIIGNNNDRFVHNDELRVYWPLFPGLANPSPGELVYVLFEDKEMNFGVWLSKVPFENKFTGSNKILFRDVAVRFDDDGRNIGTYFPDTPASPPTPTSTTVDNSGDPRGRSVGANWSDTPPST